MMKRGDKVRTTDGITGTVHKVDGITVWIDTAHGRFGMFPWELKRVR